MTGTVINVYGTLVLNMQTGDLADITERIDEMTSQVDEVLTELSAVKAQLATQQAASETNRQRTDLAITGLHTLKGVVDAMIAGGSLSAEDQQKLAQASTDLKAIATTLKADEAADAAQADEVNVAIQETSPAN